MKKVDIYLDGPNINEIKQSYDEEIAGYTFNPTLFKNLGVVDYLDFSRELVNLSRGLPISLEVIGDDYETMVKQANRLASLSSNVYVKVPITYTSGQSTIDTIENLAELRIKLNITAIFTFQQVEQILPVIRDSNSIISVFAGRIYDIGMDAVDKLRSITSYVRDQSNCKVLWASPRMHYDYIKAGLSGCDIITMPPSMYKKMGLIGKSPEEYSVETVKMFYKDAQMSGFEIK